MIRRRPTNTLRNATRRTLSREIRTSSYVLAGPDAGAPPPQETTQRAPVEAPQRRDGKTLRAHPLWMDIADQRDLQVLAPSSIEPRFIGSAFAFSNASPDPFRIYGVPRAAEKEFNFLSRPYSVVRGATVELTRLLDKSKSPEYSPRVVLTGAPGSGKSYLLLQAISYYMASKWIVLSIPKAIELVNCSTPYTYDARTRTFLQPIASATILRQLRDTGHPGLKSILLQTDFSLEKAPTGAPTAGSPLMQLIEYGIREVSVASFVLEAVLAELSTQTQHPFLLAIDDFQAFYGPSSYKTPQFTPIDGYHLSVPRLMMEYACGSRKIKNGAILGAISLYDTAFLPRTELYEALSLDLAHGKRPDAYSKRSEVLQYYCDGLQAFPVPNRLDVQEAAGIFEVWMKERALHTAGSDQLFLSKYCEADGNAREFVWRGLMNTLDT